MHAGCAKSRPCNATSTTDRLLSGLHALLASGHRRAHSRLTSIDSRRPTRRCSTNRHGREGKGRPARAPLPYPVVQCVIANSGLPLASLISVAQVFSTERDDVRGHRHVIELIGHLGALGVGPGKELERFGCGGRILRLLVDQDPGRRRHRPGCRARLVAENHAVAGTEFQSALAAAAWNAAIVGATVLPSLLIILV